MEEKIEATPEMVQALATLKSQVAKLQTDIQNDVTTLTNVYNGCADGLGAHAENMGNGVEAAASVAQNNGKAALEDLSNNLQTLHDNINDYIQTQGQMSTSGQAGSGS